jgi:hypothetical protein
MRRESIRQGLRVLTVTAAVVTAWPVADAAILYVDNRQGADVYNGHTARPIDIASGPVRTIDRALRLAGPGDTIIIANTGVPYTGPVALAGSQNGGFERLPLTIVGNGAVVDGSQPVHPSAWTRVAPGLWRMTPWRKGTYLLLEGGRPLPEHPRPPNLDGLADLAEGHWTAYRGSIYLRLPGLEEPVDRVLGLAWEPMGLSLYKVQHVVIRDLTFQHFQVDGVNLHDLCSDVILENVRSIENARAGVTVAGSSAVTLRNCELAGNGRASLLILEKGGAEVDAASQLSEPPTVAE